MKIYKLFVALTMGVCAVACNSTKSEAPAEGDEATSEVIPEEKTAKDFLPSRKEVKDVSYLVGVNFGSFIKGYNFGDLDMAQIRKGMEDFINAKQNNDPDEFVKQFRVDPNTMNELFNNYLKNRHDYTVYSNKEKQEKFLAKNAKKDGVKITPSGLQYKIISEGNEIHPEPKDTVWAQYKGSLLDGTVFDETTEETGSRKFTLNSVISGWKEGLALIGEGGEIELYVPYQLGYGENGNRSIGPAETLIFNISLEKVGKFVPKPEEKK
jgi:FKBP-type peptidyl-prolyl cis-trans isomerase